MYHQYFGLRESAFAIAVNPRYLYMSDQHRDALAHLLFGLQGGGFVQLTGEVGTGKTTIIRCLLDQLPKHTEIALVLNPMASVPELLSTICDELGARYHADNPTVKSLTDALYNKLLDNHIEGHKTVLLIDEAQNLSAEALEQIRLLTNLETHTEKLLNIILVGQPELADMLAQPSLRQLAQRITARFHLRPLTEAETIAYIRHRLRVAGLPWGRVLIPETIEKQVHQFSGGIPRLINILCERMLLGAYGQNRNEVDQALFDQARVEITGEQANGSDTEAPTALPTPPPAPRRRNRWALPLGGVALLLVGGLIGWLAGAWGPAWTPLPQAASVASSEASSESSAVGASSASEVAAAEPAEPDLLDYQWPLELDPARRQLAEALALPAPDAPCAGEGDTGYACVRSELETWNDLRELDRPAVLTVITPERKRAYVPLLGLGEQSLLAWVDGERTQLPWAELAPLWNGEVHYFHYQITGFDGSLSPGEEGPAVQWLAERFAEMDGESTPLTTDRYNRALSRRVEIFQRQQGLNADGLFGENTLRRLARVLGLDPGLEPVEPVEPAKEDV